MEKERVVRFVHVENTSQLALTRLSPASALATVYSFLFSHVPRDGPALKVQERARAHAASWPLPTPFSVHSCERRSRELSRKTVAERKLMEAAKISSRYKTAFPSSSDGGGHGANNDADDYGDDDDDQEYGGGGEGGWTDDSEVEARKRRRASSSSPASSDKSEQRKGGCSTSGGPTGLSNDVIDDSGSGGNTGEKNKKPTSGDGVVGSRGVQGPCLTLGLGTLSWKSVASGWWSPGESEGERMMTGRRKVFRQKHQLRGSKK